MIGTRSARRRLVLVGGGHSHVQLLRRFAMAPIPAELIVVLDTPVAIYSGMVPGFVAGQYQKHELEIDVVPLARRAGARVILAPAIGIRALQHELLLEGRPPLPFDLISFDVGSTVWGGDLPGVRRWAWSTRPLGAFVRAFDRRLREWRGSARNHLRLIVVGGGAGGVELAFTLRQRLLNDGFDPEIHLIQDGPQLLPGQSRWLRHLVGEAAATAGIQVALGRRVQAVEPRHESQNGFLVHLAGESSLEADAVIWAGGASGLPLFQGSDLELDARGFVKIHSTLQAVGHDHVFAAGDCASLTAAPETPKAGVYAVRQGPFLEHNLRALLSGRPLKNYRPQRDFLTLLNLGDGTAIGGKWGLAGRAPALMRLKDRIDRRFMERFQVLDFKGVPTPNFKPMTEMEMFCGGCAAKIGQTVLERALRRLPAALTAKADLGLKEADDVAAVRLGSEVVVSSIDAFRAFTDDPYLVGRVAAINAVSDLFAKGVEPDHALLLVALPQDLDNGASEELLFQVASGVRAALDPLEVELVGGHTTTAPELLVGLTVIGRQNPARPLATKSGLEVGQILILTKALGTGVVLHADMKAQLRGEWLETALASMLRPNAAAAEAALGCGAGAMTDVTGFGLVGHLADLLRASHLGARLRLGALPVLPGALELLERGLRSTFHEKNAAQRRGLMVAPELQDAVALELLFDPQTSGGLLFGIPAEKAEQTLERLHAVGDHAARAIGEVVPLRSDGVRILVE